MTEQEFKQKADKLIEDIRALGVEVPDIPPGYDVTWETLGNLTLILAGQQFLVKSRQEAIV